MPRDHGGGRETVLITDEFALNPYYFEKGEKPAALYAARPTGRKAVPFIR